MLARRLEPIRSQVQRVVYEAGPTGYALVRTLRAAGFAADVIVRRRCCERRSPAPRATVWTAARWPNMPARICSSRSRFPANSKSGIGRSRGCVNASPAKLRLARQQIKSFLLVHGIAQPVGLNCWSDKGIDGLRSLKLDEQLRFCLDVLIEEEQHAYKQVEKVTLELKKLATEERFRERIRCLRPSPAWDCLRP